MASEGSGLLRRAVSGHVDARELGPYGRKTMPAGSALLVVVTALLLGGLLNVQSLVDAAERQPFGWQRDVALVAVWPFRQVSELLGLDQPQQLLAERLGRVEDAGADGSGVGVGAGEGDVVGTPEDPLLTDALAAAAALAGREAIDTALGDATAIPAGIDPDAPALAEAPSLTDRLSREFTEEAPLRLLVVGDSLTEQLGPALISRAGRPGVPITADHDFTYSSGLTRPDFYDWPARAAQLAQEADPDIWVVMVGANDAQDIRDPSGRFVHLGSDEWEAAYLDRIGVLMDQLTADGRAVVWVGQPLMRDAAFDESMRYLSELYARQAARRTLVSFVDARAVFADEQGLYADYLPAVTGQLVQVRLGDGIHMTRAGAERLAAQIMPLLPVDPAVGAEDDRTDTG